MTDDALVVVLEGRSIGEIHRASSGALRLVYNEDYADDPDATLLSVSMAPPVRDHTDASVTPWLWGLLPDNADVLTRWGQKFGVSVASPFPLLGTQIGHDCAGAVQFCRSAELDDLLRRPSEITWLTEAQVAARLRELRADSTAWLGRGFTGQFSLGGAQAKTALYLDGDRWGLPSGSVPTTHILKPAIGGIEWQDLNEHLCLAAARCLGLRAGLTRVEQFEDQTAIVVERYDRHVADGQLVRIHQEDMCQATRTPPAAKYQADGGPSPLQVANLLRAVMPAPVAEDAVWRFVDALVFNWVIGGTDAHARNYSLLLAGTQVRLAPLYDIASALPYDDSKGNDLKLAMKIGGEYALLRVDRRRTWEKAAADLGVDAEALVGRALDLARRIPAAFATAAADAAVTELASTLPSRLVELVSARAHRCVAAIE